MAMLCLNGMAQKKETAFSIGDKLPDVHFEHILNYTNSNAKLSDFKGRLLVLEFWASWCSTCLEMFPKLDSLQKSLKSELQIVLVNSNINDRGVKGEQFFKTWIDKNNPQYSVPSIMSDSSLKKMLPHKYLPYAVIISPDSEILAFVSPLQLSENLLKVFINQSQPSPK